MKILVLDIETTGFKTKKDLILEIGIVKLDLETGIVTPIYSELVKEEGFDCRFEKSWIFANSNLRFEEIMHAKELDLIEIQKILGNNYVAAWNSSFDFGFLKSRGLVFNTLPCPMKTSNTFFKLPGKYGGFKWASVQEAWDRIFPKIKYKEEHRGLDDAVHEAKIMYSLYYKKVWKIKHILENAE